MSILIADDSPHIHAQLSQILAMAGFLDLLFAPGAREAFGCLGMDKEKKASFLPGSARSWH
ncbi:MAG: hypothetical protein GXP53_06980 [Deltaproteobacteria bacterium]|nr:hypothetical protein [Deltaproteobacteria bacterium]